MHYLTPVLAGYNAHIRYDTSKVFLRLRLSPLVFFRARPDRCLTAVGAPSVLARNYAGYTSLGRPRQGRWGVEGKEETPFKMASAFLKDRRDICVPVELLAGLIDEDRCVCVRVSLRVEERDIALYF